MPPHAIPDHIAVINRPCPALMKYYVLKALATTIAAPVTLTVLYFRFHTFLVFTASVVFTFFSQRLNYSLRWYVVTDRSLRIRTGVFNMQELTMTFSNIQEIRVTAGPLQNLLKLADVEVQSAGGGSKGGGDSHIGRFRCVSNANAIRDLMVERLRQYRDSGLGEAPTPKGPASDPAIDAARAVLAEARALREHLTSSSS